MLSYTFFSQSSSLWTEVLELRMKVFVQEMQVPRELELDQYDMDAIHLCVQDNEQTIGTLRLVREDDSVKIGRFALNKAYRRQGIGTQMMHSVYFWCRQEAIYHLYLDAQTYVVPFYKALGFAAKGEVFMDAGIPHIRMVLILPEVL